MPDLGEVGRFRGAIKHGIRAGNCPNRIPRFVHEVVDGLKGIGDGNALHHGPQRYQ